MTNCNRAAAIFALWCLAGCDARPPERAAQLTVTTQTISLQAYAQTMTITGEVRARVQADLSFRVSGRVIERLGEVGRHVEAGAVLARLDPTEQKADLDSALAGRVGALATLHQAQAAFDRQQALLDSGFTTRAAFDLAKQALRTATGSVEVAEAQVAAAQDAMSCTRLQVERAGVVTSRNIEVGEVAQAAQPIFGFAEDGPRDATFAIYESMLSRRPDAIVDLNLVSDPHVAARGKIYEVAPVVDRRTGTVLVKVEIDPALRPMPLGASVVGRSAWRMDEVVVLPWTALSQRNGKSAVWVVDPATQAVSLRDVTVAAYETERIVVRAGLKSGEIVVTDGGKFLREGQILPAVKGERG